MSLESLQNSPGSSLMGGSCSLRGAHSMPLPMHAQPSPQGPRLAPSVQVYSSHNVRRMLLPQHAV